MSCCDYDQDDPPLHSIVTTRFPNWSFHLDAVETLPPGWVNVRLYTFDQRIGRHLYQVEECPARLHFESWTEETLLQGADPEGDLWSPWGDPWDDHPVVVATTRVETPCRYSSYADPQWKEAYVEGGYIGTCLAEKVGDLLTAEGFPDAIPLPNDWAPPEDD